MARIQPHNLIPLFFLATVLTAIAVASSVGFDEVSRWCEERYGIKVMCQMSCLDCCHRYEAEHNITLDCEDMCPPSSQSAYAFMGASVFEQTVLLLGGLSVFAGLLVVGVYPIYALALGVVIGWVLIDMYADGHRLAALAASTLLFATIIVLLMVYARKAGVGNDG